MQSTYKLLEAFRAVFENRQYRHRSSNQGDKVAYMLYEDLYDLGRSERFRHRVDERERVLNVENRRQGIDARRGDGTFGEIVPNVVAIVDPGFSVARGPIATVEVGVEVKIVAKAMNKQIDRVRSDLVGQVAHFRRGAGNPICVGVAGINSAAFCVSYEGDRSYRTDGRKYANPCDEASSAENYLLKHAAPAFDEFLVLRYKATNEDPYPFEWVDYQRTFNDYGAILTRISREYDSRF